MFLGETVRQLAVGFQLLFVCFAARRVPFGFGFRVSRNRGFNNHPSSRRAQVANKRVAPARTVKNKVDFAQVTGASGTRHRRHRRGSRFRRFRNERASPRLASHGNAENLHRFGRFISVVLIRRTSTYDSHRIRSQVGDVPAQGQQTRPQRRGGFELVPAAAGRASRGGASDYVKESVSLASYCISRCMDKQSPAER